MLTARIWSEFERDCATVSALLAEHSSQNLHSLHWYGIPIHDVVSEAGQSFIREWNETNRERDEIADNYGLVSLYNTASPREGLDESGATVWRCDAIQSTPWYDEPSPVVDLLEANADAIIHEYKEEWLHRARTHPDNMSLVDRGRWKGLFFSDVGGVRNEELRGRCAVTANLIDRVPMCNAFGFAMISGLEPHSHIKAHCGSSNLRLRHHLGLDVPEPDAARLRVGREWRQWAEGSAFAFDDSFEHEVVHEGNLPRVALVVDVWHPSLDEDDISVLSHDVFRRFGRVQNTGSQ